MTISAQFEFKLTLQSFIQEVKCLCRKFEVVLRALLQQRSCTAPSLPYIIAGLRGASLTYTQDLF